MCKTIVSGGVNMNDEDIKIYDPAALKTPPKYDPDGEMKIYSPFSDSSLAEHSAHLP